MIKKLIRTDLRQHFFTKRIINVWNSLDELLVPTVSQFQKQSTTIPESHEDESYLGHLCPMTQRLTQESGEDSTW